MPFGGLIDAVLVDPPHQIAFDGSLARADAEAIWQWLCRDSGRDLDSEPPERVAERLVEMTAVISAAVSRIGADETTDRRLQAQLGGGEAWRRLPVALTILRCVPLLQQAQAFGRASNGLTDVQVLSSALRVVPLTDQALAAVFFHAAVGEIADPGRLMHAAVLLAGGDRQSQLEQAGFTPLIEALLSQAQNQIGRMAGGGTFADTDLACLAINRFHDLLHAISAHVELRRGDRQGAIFAALVAAMSDRIAPRLADVVPDLNAALRAAREGSDRIDPDRQLAALNGMYLLAAARDSRESLALNVVLDKTWQQAGQALEFHLGRNLDSLRADPADSLAAARIETGLKLAEVRFSPDYAATLGRAAASAAKRVDQQGQAAGG